MDDQNKKKLLIAYDAAAHEYAQQNFDELDHKPLDRKFLGLFAERIIPGGRVCEIGCGPGEVAHYLKSRGVNIFGIDISPKMIEEARRLSPDIEFEQGDVFDLKFEENSFAGIVAFYLIVNFPREDIPKAIAEMFRVLIQGGILLLSFHLGQETIHLEEFLGQKVPIDFRFFHQNEIVPQKKIGGFERYVENLLPYYAGMIEYTTEFTLERIPESDEVIVEFDYGEPFHEATEVSINESEYTPVLWQPRHLKFAADRLHVGNNTLRTCVYTTLIRSFEGQWFDYHRHEYREIEEEPTT